MLNILSKKMFTGIIKNYGLLKKFKDNEIVIEINHDKVINLGDSIACNGVCLTVSKIKDHLYSFNLSSETLNKTTFLKLKIDDLINIEFSARIGDENGGHNVTGHVHGVAIINDIKKNNQDWCFSFNLDEEIAQYVIYKDSIAVNGISLTVSNFDKSLRCFEVSVIPFTFYNTNLKNLKIGDCVNIEVNMDAVRISELMKRLNK